MITKGRGLTFSSPDTANKPSTLAEVKPRLVSYQLKIMTLRKIVKRKTYYTYYNIGEEQRRLTLI